MKKLVVLSMLIIWATFSSAQVYVDGININTIEDLHLIQMVGSSKLFNDDVNIKIDYGQHSSMSKKPKRNVTNKEGKKLNFQSIIAACNFLENKGWQFVTAYALTKGNSNVYHYTFRKKSK